MLEMTEHVKTRAVEAGKPRSIQQKSVFRKGDAHRRSHSIQQKVGAAVRLSQEPSDEDHVENSGACVTDHRAAVQERKRDRTRDVSPRTTTTLVVLNASADHTVVESRIREDRTACSERQW